MNNEILEDIVYLLEKRNTCWFALTRGFCFTLGAVSASAGLAMVLVLIKSIIERM